MVVKVVAAISLYDLESYNFGTKEATPGKDPSAEARVARLEERFHEQGCGLT